VTRDEVLEIAGELFARAGLGAVGLGAVQGAEDHFDSDVALRRALVLVGFEHPVARVVDAVERAEGGEAAFGAFVDAFARGAYDDPTHIMLHLAPMFSGAAGLLQPDQSYRDAIASAGAKMFRPVAAKLRDTWGDELPQGIHPRRLTFLACMAIVGMTGMRLASETLGNRFVHSADEMVDELVRALGSPTTIMRQLAALNDVAKAISAMRDEESLLQAVPALLSTALEVDSSAIVRSDALAADGPANELTAICRRAITDKRSVLDTKADTATIAVPYFCQQEVEGAIAGRVATQRRTLDRRDLSRFETFATMVGLAIQNARWVDLVQTEKMSAMSRLVAGVAHDLNTPLGAMMATADVSDKAVDRLVAAIEQGDEAKTARALSILRDSQKTTRTAATRVNERIHALRSFARLDESERKRASLHHGIDSTLVLFAQQLGTMTVQKSYGDLPDIECFPNELNQVFMNIILNAATATNAEGSLTITTTCSAHEVSVSLTDDGKGMPADEVKRIFEPGYTRWGLTVGAGLGLSTCLRIVKKHDGRIDVDSTPGVGSTFHVVLPYAG
jgi:two-component system NtrC family sensor kinase